MNDAGNQLASRWKRLWGAMIDAIIGIAITFPLMKVMGLWQNPAAGQVLTLGQRVFVFFLGLAVFLALNGYLLAKHGQTLGKRLVRTRIVAVNGDTILPFPKLLGLRYLPLWLVNYVPVVGPVLVLLDALFVFRSDKRCVHDLIAGTTVVAA